MSKKYFVFVLIFVLILSCFFCGNYFKKTDKVFASGVSSYLDISADLENIVDEQIDNLNGDEFDDILNNLGEKEKSVFNGKSFFEKLKDIIAGKDNFDFGNIIHIVLSLFLDNLSGIIPMLAIICAVAIISSILLQFRGKSLNKSLGNIIHFACFSIVAVLVLTAVFELVKITANTLNSLKSQMEISFPIMLTLMASLGAGSSVAIYQPLLAILSGVMAGIFSNIILPIFSLNLIFSVVGNLTETVKLSKISNFLNSLCKYIIGFVFTIFSGFMAVSGIVAGNYDGISIRATKFAIKSYVPIMGGYLSDGFSLIMASSVLIKNVVGYSGLIIMFLTIISPLIKIVLFKLGLSLVSGIIESVADKRITNFVSSTAKSLTMLSSIILAFAFSYLISVGLMMCTTNVF